jgi:hypothetical protein
VLHVLPAEQSVFELHPHAVGIVPVPTRQALPPDWNPEQSAQVPPPAPQAEADVPATHDVPEQQPPLQGRWPEHEVVQMPGTPLQAYPAGQSLARMHAQACAPPSDVAVHLGVVPPQTRPQPPQFAVPARSAHVTPQTS